ncbi:MAG: NAD-dependent epimerase/dehydratase family protein [Stackebrandtia sp.]
MTQQRILITGGAGKVAQMLRPRLARDGRSLRLLDLREPEPLPGTGDEEVVLGSVTDAAAMAEACRGVDAVIHLGGQSVEATAENVIDLNIRGTLTTLEATRAAGVRRIVLASSNHAVGFCGRDEAPVAANSPGRPDTFYGLSKVTMEAAGHMYADRYGLDVIALRIGSWFPTPPGVRGLATWLSPDDGARLVEACLAVGSPGFRIVWGISRNTRRWFSLAEGQAIGYHPEDDAETYAAELIAEHGEPDFTSDAELNRVGGAWCEVELGKPM